MSVWTRTNGGRNIKIRFVNLQLLCLVMDLLTDMPLFSDTIKRLLAFPADTNIVWKSHDDSIAQRSLIDQARHEKGTGSGPHHGQGKRRETINEDSAPDKSRGTAA